ncbi:hypothetical protein [Clostridium magnum]|uniref:Uncharacterized protein n=1 Tax=Clostridium magnum DSM 2767 TaxID=1121326 RepID=A0A162UQU5_9CLOT|nr:hypothetical protein [Clostridium magnum]KZL94193.1 hypothetical protein CLMAG_12460 [Clostridium magnum DSM 2767]SHH93161.1 hypothetical protein SAMN02745944_01807 [Clostridium magnum DSM 2767]
MDARSHEDLIKVFILSVKEKYSDLIIDYAYDEDVGMYDIWHNNKVLQFESESFLEFIGSKMKEILYNNGMFNFSFGYDYIKAKSLEPSYILQKDTTVYANPSIIQSKHMPAINRFSYSINLEKDTISNVRPNFVFTSGEGLSTFGFYSEVQNIVLNEPTLQLAHVKKKVEEMGLAA